MTDAEHADFVALSDERKRLTGVEAALRAEVERLRGDVANAVRCAKEYQPDYPWDQNTASEAVWACGEGYRGVCMAVADWQKYAADLEKICAAVAEQQAMPDDWWERAIAASRDAVWGEKHSAAARAALEGKP